VETTDGNKPLAPVLMRQSNPKQRVTFDGDRPSRFTQKRCKEIGCTTRVARDAARGHAASPVQGSPAVHLSDDVTLARLIQSKAGGKTAKKT
jgi:hypothetical protein